MVGRASRVLIAIAVTATLGGCNLLQLTPTSEVVRTRVAGVRAQPAEIALGESTQLDSLLVFPQSPPPEYGQIWFACLEAGGAAGCLGLDFSGLAEAGAGDDDDGTDDDDAAPPPDFDPRDVQFGVGETFTYLAQGPLLEEAWSDLEPEERVEGLTVLVSVNYVRRSNDALEAMLAELLLAAQNGDGETVERVGAEFGSLLENGLSAARRVVISDKTSAEPDPVTCPVTELLPNQNPRIDGLEMHLAEDGNDAGFALGEVTFVEPGTELTLRPQIGEDVFEDYLFIDSDDETRCRRETPYFAWLTNDGSVDHDYSFVADEGDLDEVEGRPKVNILTLPGPEHFGDGVDLWLVMRDRRGGLTWDHRRFVALESP